MEVVDRSWVNEVKNQGTCPTSSYIACPSNSAVMVHHSLPGTCAASPCTKAGVCKLSSREVYMCLSPSTAKEVEVAGYRQHRKQAQMDSNKPFTCPQPLSSKSNVSQKAWSNEPFI